MCILMLGSTDVGLCTLVDSIKSNYSTCGRDMPTIPLVRYLEGKYSNQTQSTRVSPTKFRRYSYLLCPGPWDNIVITLCSNLWVGMTMLGVRIESI
jgi:hypothetical protein